MANMLLDMAMSLGGFISDPKGEDHRLHDYFFSPGSPTIQVIEEGFKTTGAIIMGRYSCESGVGKIIVSEPVNVRVMNGS